MNAFTIKDLENLSGIKAHTIRIWEQRYSFLRPHRTDTNIRFYSNEHLKLLLNVALLNKHGYKISHIDKMSEEEMKEKILKLAGAEAQNESMINLLIQAMIDLDMEGFESHLNHYVLSHSFESAVTHIIFPFLERIGVLWMTNHINPSHEHLVTNIVRQKLIVGIENLTTPSHPNKIVILFLPENEHHELGLLYAYYLMKSKGIKVIYLGATVPLKDLEYIIKRTNPTFAYSHITCIPSHFNVDKYIQNLHTRVPETPVILSGQIAQHYKKQLPQNILLKRSLQEVNDFLTSV